jgi:hypothetical protein
MKAAAAARSDPIMTRRRSTLSPSAPAQGATAAPEANIRTSVAATHGPECPLRWYTTVTMATYDTVVPVIEINCAADNKRMFRRYASARRKAPSPRTAPRNPVNVS